MGEAEQTTNMTLPTEEDRATRFGEWRAWYSDGSHDFATCITVPPGLVPATRPGGAICEMISSWSTRSSRSGRTPRAALLRNHDDRRVLVSVQPGRWSPLVVKRRRLWVRATRPVTRAISVVPLSSSAALPAPNLDDFGGDRDEKDHLDDVGVS